MLSNELPGGCDKVLKESQGPNDDMKHPTVFLSISEVNILKSAHAFKTMFGLKLAVLWASLQTTFSTWFGWGLGMKLLA